LNPIALENNQHKVGYTFDDKSFGYITIS
jgi:hypothetical protein